MAGIQLQGVVQQAVVNVKIRNRSSMTNEKITYEDLAVKLVTSAEHGRLKVVFANWLQSVKIRSSNGVKAPIRKLQHVNLTRKQTEPIIQFILRGMEVTAMKVMYGK